MKLDLSYNNLTTLSTTSFPEGLTELIVHGNKIKVLPPLPPTLKVLSCYNNQLVNIPPLPDEVTELYCGHNRLTSLPTLPPSLTYLDCGNNQLTSLPPLPSTLTKLNCWNNKLTSLPSLPPSLTTLHCSHNKLLSLPPLPQFTWLSCGENPLPPHYFDGGHLKGISKLRSIIMIDRLRKAYSILVRLISDKAARNIQRMWKRYLLEPYHDPQLGYRVSRYMLYHQHEL